MNKFQIGLQLINNSTARSVKTFAKQGIKSTTNPFEKVADKQVGDILELSTHAKPKLVTPQEFKTNYCKTMDDELRIFPFEEKDVIKLAQMEDGNFNKEILDTILNLRKFGLPQNERIETAANMTAFLLDKNGKVDKQMKESLMKFLEENKKYGSIDSFFWGFDVSKINYSQETKKSILGFLEDCPKIFRSHCVAEDVGDIVRSYIPANLSEKDVSHRLKNLKRIYENLIEEDKIQRIGFLLDLKNPRYYSTGTTPEKAMEYFERFIDSGLIPNLKICDYYTDHTEDVIRGINNLKKQGIEFVDIRDADVLEQVISGQNQKINEFISKNAKQGFNYLGGKIEPFDANNYAITLRNNNGTNGIGCTLNKNTNQIQSIKHLKMSETKAQLSSVLPKKNRTISQEYSTGLDGYPHLRKETVQAKNERIFLIDSNISGQADVFRVKGRKIEVLSRGFRDPITGEEIVKRKFKSYNKVKTNYKYKSRKDGNSELSYTIKNRSGQTLMRVRRHVQKVGENHFVHKINGKKYDVVFENNIVKITEDNGSQTVIDLSQHVVAGENNQKILETLKRIPPDELLNLKKLENPKFSQAEESACNYVFGRNLKDITIAKEDAEKLFTYLHELGHLKFNQLQPEEIENIKKVYLKEVERFKKETNCLNIGTMDYLIDNSEHYLNQSGYGAIEEAFADTNAHLMTPNTDNTLTERTVKFMEQFPETIAEISKYL